MWVQLLVKELRSHVPGAQYCQSKVRAGQRTETTTACLGPGTRLSTALEESDIGDGRAAEGVPGVFR